MLTETRSRQWYWLVRDGLFGEQLHGPYRDAIEAAEYMNQLDLWGHEPSAGANYGWRIEQR